MRYKNIELFNIKDIEETEDGTTLFRFPKSVTSAVSGTAALNQGCELRFRSSGDNVTLCVRAPKGGSLFIYHGDYFSCEHRLTPNEKTVINLTKPERLGWVYDDVLIKRRFSSDLWRVFIDCPLLTFYYLTGKEISPPEREDTPELTWGAYGSSITYGRCATSTLHSYIQIAADDLGADVCNMGFPGSCYCEKEIADFIAAQKFSFVSLELGVNMRNVFSDDDFRQRAEYMLQTITSMQPGMPVFIITIMPNHAIASKVGSVYTAQHHTFNRILEELAGKKYSSPVHLIDGNSLIKDFTELTCDLIHPSDYGHRKIAERVAGEIKKHL